jgi:hypothetical protein
MASASTRPARIVGWLGSHDGFLPAIAASGASPAQVLRQCDRQRLAAVLFSREVMERLHHSVAALRACCRLVEWRQAGSHPHHRSVPVKTITMTTALQNSHGGTSKASVMMKVFSTRFRAMAP